MGNWGRSIEAHISPCRDKLRRWLKEFFAVALIFLSFPMISRADLAGRDEVTARLRQEFSLAKTPTIKQLQAGKQWVCPFHLAKSGSDDSGQMVTSFESSESFVIASVWENQTKSISFFMFDPGVGLWSKVDRWNYVVLRITDQGNLIAEDSAPFQQGLTDPSLSIANQGAYSYYLCH